MIVESNYEYRFRESEKYFRRRKTEHGKCYNTNIYSFDGENLKLEEQDLNTLFL